MLFYIGTTPSEEEVTELRQRHTVAFADERRNPSRAYLLAENPASTKGIHL